MQLSDHLSTGPASQQWYSSLEPSCKATVPVPLLTQHPRGQGTQNWVLQAPWARLALETGLESIHPTGKVVLDGCCGYCRGQQAGAQLGEISSFKGMIQRRDTWCTCPDGYRGKHIEEAKLCHSGNMAEYIYTHIHTHTRDFLTL